MAPEKKWHNSGTPKQFHWSRVILGKLDAMVNPDIDRRPTLFASSSNIAIVDHVGASGLSL